MSWKIVSEKPEIWDQILQDSGPRSGTFLQSFEWGDFQKKYGREVVRAVFESSNKTLGIAQGIIMPLPLGQSYIAFFRGPIGKLTLPNILVSSEQIASQAIFSRFELPLLDGTINGYQVNSFQPSETWITNLSMNTDQLLQGMHSKTRYNIRLAERKDVEVKEVAEITDEIWSLFSQTANRGEFILHSRKYYQTMLDTLQNNKSCSAKLWVATVGGKIRASILTIDSFFTRTYLHGASSREDRGVMAPFLLHWKVIENAQQNGLLWYDWWGIAPENYTKTHHWAGITRFKVGFPGERVSYIKAYEVPLKIFSYRGYRSVKRILSLLHLR